MTVCEEDVQDIFDSICRARQMHDNAAILRGFQDLEDAGIKPKIYFRMVAVNGDRLRYHVNFATDNLVIDSVNGIKNHVLLAKYKEILESEEFYKNAWDFIKHHNDMSPEEYKWCMLDDF